MSLQHFSRIFISRGFLFTQIFAFLYSSLSILFFSAVSSLRFAVASECLVLGLGESLGGVGGLKLEFVGRCRLKLNIL